jgi:hypothetical protein
MLCLPKELRKITEFTDIFCEKNEGFCVSKQLVYTFMIFHCIIDAND